MIAHSASRIGSDGWTAKEGIAASDRVLLRELAHRVRELSERPIEAEKRQLWLDHNELKATRPVVFCDPEHGWTEILPESVLACRGDMARSWEMLLRKEIFWAEGMRDDKVIEAVFRVPHVSRLTGWGLSERKIQHDEQGSYVWEAPLTDYAMMDRLRFPQVEVDEADSRDLLDLAREVFGDILEVRRHSTWWWTLGMTWTLVNLRGLSQVLYDFLDNSDSLHSLMAFLRDGTLSLLDRLEQQDLLALNNDGTYVGSGGFGWSRELPAPDFAGHVRTRDMWGFGESQETTCVSPEMFAEFVLPYQVPVLDRFGLNCYGCCEPLDARWQHVLQVPRLRRVSVSPWASVPGMAERLGERYIFSYKPNPAYLATPTPDFGTIPRHWPQNRPGCGCLS